MMTPRPVQQLVPAGDAAVRRSPDAGQRLIPADEQAGSPAPVESPQRLEALVEALWAELRILVRYQAAHWQQGHYLTAWAYELVAVLIARRISKRLRASTGGNGGTEERREPRANET